MSRYLTWLLIASAVAAAWQPFLMAYGRLFVERHDAAPADAIVVLLGSYPDRILHAVDLYHQGYAPRLVMVSSRWPQKAQATLEARGLSPWGEADANREVALTLGIPPADIIVLPAQPTSTVEEARAIGAAGVGSSFLLVTSSYHSARARRVFADVLPQTRIVSQPSPYDDYDPRTWWRTRTGRRTVLLESQKWLYYLLAERP